MTTPPTTQRRTRMWRPYLKAGRIRIPTYGAMLYVGFTVGVIAAACITHLNYTRFAAASLCLLVAALIGARAWYLVGHRDQQRAATGAGLYGGLMSSFVCSWPAVRLADLEFWHFWDGAAVVLLTGMVVTRVGCLLTGCCAGRETSAWVGMWLPDAAGNCVRRFPTQLFELAWSAAILGVGVMLYSPSHRPGALFVGAAAAYGLGRVVLERLRADWMPGSRWTRINVAFSLVLATGAPACYVVATL